MFFGEEDAVGICTDLAVALSAAANILVSFSGADLN